MVCGLPPPRRPGILDCKLPKDFIPCRDNIHNSMMDNILFKDKQLRMLLILKDSTQNWYLSTLAQRASATYVHACNFVNACESLGIATSEKHGKIKTVKLTDKGYKLAELLESANTIIKSTAKAAAEPAQPPEQQK